MAEEVRALTNFEVTGALRDREQREMAVFGKLRRRWEQEISPPRTLRAQRKFKTNIKATTRSFLSFKLQI
jgi:hypothetical protein